MGSRRYHVVKIDARAYEGAKAYTVNMTRSAVVCFLQYQNYEVA